MLSAIAARKAAAAAANATQSLDTSAGPSTILSSTSAPSSKPNSSSSKRKRPPATPQTSTSGSPFRKRKKSASKKIPQPRYFELQNDAFRGQEDVELENLDSDELEDSDLDSETDHGMGGGLDNTIVHVDVDGIDTSKKQIAKRSYSPSRPALDDSSQDEEDANGGILGQAGETLREDNTLLTSFIPMEGKNTFYLAAAEVAIILSSTRSSSSNSPSQSGTLIALKPSETLTLLGTYQLTVIQGFIEVDGAILRSDLHQSHKIFAPRSSPLPGLRALSLPSPILSSSFILPERLETIIGEARNDIVILLQDLQTGVEGLGKVCRTFEGVFSIHPRDVLNLNHSENPQGNGDVGNTLQLKGARVIARQSKYISPFSMPSSWQQALDGIYPMSKDAAEEKNGDIEMRNEQDDDGEERGRQTPNIYLVKGLKKVGKSSFARTLVNRLLSRHDCVAYLECDLGQSEFTPGGLVALNVVHRSQPLLGPPFTHPTIPIRAHFLGAFSPKSSPGHYIEAVRDLVGYWTREMGAASSIPLVVNTMGWTNGLGGDLTRRIEEILLGGLSEVSLESSLAYGRVSLSQENGGPEMHLYGFDYETSGESAFTDSSTSNRLQSHIQPPSYSSFFGQGTGDPSSSLPTFSSQPAPRIHVHRMKPVSLPVSSSSSGLPYAPASTTGPLGNFSAADHRTLNILSYFHAVFPLSVSPSSGQNQPQFSNARATHWDTSLPLLARPPYEVDVGVAVDKVVLLSGNGDEGEVVESEIERVLGGALVGLVKCEPGTLDMGSNSESMSAGRNSPSSTTKITKIPYVQSSPYPSPNTSSTCGLALIRSVAPGGSHLHVLTPLPPSLLGPFGRVMVKGEMELPIWGMVDFRSLGRGRGQGRDGEHDRERETATPFLQWDKGAGLGAEKRRVRRNLMRKNQGV
ncbi:hypothetical protein GYMLUDRAFT_206207 [Collybiopsis luxurians FD-317 M1]|uniref:Polynucleotide 5'-hydroxyl-kinase GRC3 n=1 Tax=Collybiopsis luxurians FD-317 M1 TaxID=944289 RepID=A0A0D0AVY8_9AGAR|nr:hypothetical protein GYMLUDRAFT_206207 [Collybiopsis luxurians FD-317 M1]